jgi:hypothetical protein
MSVYARYGERRVVSAYVSVPYYGAPAADLVMGTDETVPDRGDVVLGPLTLRMAVTRQGVLAGTRGVGLVGGYGGWRTTVAKEGYANAAGVRLATVLGDVARACGETVTGFDTSATVGVHYARREGPAVRVLREVGGSLWWVGLDGVTHLDARSTSPIATPFAVESRDGANGRLRVSTEHPQDWMPGRTFAGPTFPDVLSIAHTGITLGEDGKLRLEVLVQ